MIDIGLLNLRWAIALADGLVAAGLADLVLSPGSRSTPLALAFLRQPALRCHVILDERSAAFFALGIAKVSGRPAAVLCTSGSAAANWFPAVIEADAGAVPLLLLSADRPPELQGWGANQTIDQKHLFGRHVRAFYEPGAPDANFSPHYAHHLAARAVSESCWPLPGPVHLNLALREPLLPSAAASDWPTATKRPTIQRAPARLLPDSGLIAHLADAMSGRPGAIICGAADYPPGFADAVTALARQLDCPILAEPLSNLRFGEHERHRLSVRYEAFLRNPSFVATYPPQWLLRFGAFPVTRSLQNWLEGGATVLETTQIVVTPDPRWPDPPHSASTILHACSLEACRALRAAKPRPAPAAWGAAFSQAESAVEAIATRYRALDSFEGALIPALLERLPSGHRLFCGNSMAIRDLDAFSGSSPKKLRLFGNRGASGIDGNLSTALGIATDGPCVALLGDLTAQHDLTALAAAGGRDLIVVVFNNGGGGIFDYLPPAALPEFERAWLTPQNVDFAAAAQAFGVAYESAATLEHFRLALARALEKGGTTLLEARIDRPLSVALHHRYWRSASALPFPFNPKLARTADARLGAEDGVDVRVG
jgi:2-succinyl-5-enolpyruvyl-6-hydroxy-3-cyclohexene-1-carboxylate synthase